MQINPNIKQAIIWAAQAWCTMKPQAVRNCFGKAGILPPAWAADFINHDERVARSVRPCVLVSRV
jgi:hypothetical protein